MSDQLHNNVVFIEVPANTTARISIPCDNPDAYGDITESGSSAGESDGVTYLASHEDRAEFEVASGTYRFQSRLSSKTNK